MILAKFLFIDKMLTVSDVRDEGQLWPKGAFTPNANKSYYSHVVGRLNILSLLASFAREIHYTRHEYASWEGLLPGSSSLVAKCVPVFVKVRRCIYSSGYPHTTTITLSSIVVSDFLPPLVMTSLLEQAPDWLTNIRQSSDFSTPRYSCESHIKRPKSSIRANSAAGLSMASLH